MKVLTDTGSCQATLSELIKVLTKLQKEYGSDIKVQIISDKSCTYNYWIHYCLKKELDNINSSYPITLNLWVD